MVVSVEIPMEVSAELPPPAAIVRLCHPHVHRFTTRVTYGKMGSRGVDLAECERYLAIWKNIEAKGGKDLTPEEEQEVLEAMASGEYDDVLVDPAALAVQEGAHDLEGS